MILAALIYLEADTWPRTMLLLQAIALAGDFFRMCYSGILELGKTSATNKAESCYRHKQSAFGSRFCYECLGKKSAGM